MTKCFLFPKNSSCFLSILSCSSSSIKTKYFFLLILVFYSIILENATYFLLKQTKHDGLGPLVKNIIYVSPFV